MKLPKEYVATFRLGLESSSHDIEGAVTVKKEFAIPTREDIENVLQKFRGAVQQIPPQFSAVKRGGKKAYREARAGREIKLEPREVTISKLETIWYKFPLLTLGISCSSGTYVRALARDIGEALGTGAIMSQLRRETIGPYRLSDAVNLKDLNSRNLEKFVRS